MIEIVSLLYNEKFWLASPVMSHAIISEASPTSLKQAAALLSKVSHGMEYIFTQLKIIKTLSKASQIAFLSIGRWNS